MNNDTKDLMTAVTEFDAAFGNSYGTRSIAVAICVFAYAFLVGMRVIAMALYSIARGGKY